MPPAGETAIGSPLPWRSGHLLPGIGRSHAAFQVLTGRLITIHIVGELLASLWPLAPDTSGVDKSTRGSAAAEDINNLSPETFQPDAVSSQVPQPHGRDLHSFDAKAMRFECAHD